jgi:hypothetical protein
VLDARPPRVSRNSTPAPWSQRVTAPVAGVGLDTLSP